MVGGGGVAQLDLSSVWPRCSRPLIENILVYLGMGPWGERVEERAEGNRVQKQGLCRGCPLRWLRSLSSGSRGSSWEWLGGWGGKAETWVSAPAQLLHPTLGKSLGLAGPQCPHLIGQVGTLRGRRARLAQTCPQPIRQSQARTQASQIPGLGSFTPIFEMRKLKFREAEAVDMPEAWLQASEPAKLRLSPRSPTGGHSGPPSHIWFQFLCQIPLSSSAPFPKPRAAWPPGTNPRTAESPG